MEDELGGHPALFAKQVGRLRLRIKTVVFRLCFLEFFKLGVVAIFGALLDIRLWE